MRILGIDPGSIATGFGIVERAAGGPVHVAHGILRPPSDAPLHQRLAFIHSGLVEVASEYSPDVSVVERVFIAANPRSALVLGQARGAALAALAAAGLEVGEWSAREVKQAVTGGGAAGKKQMQLMVARLLQLESEPPSDAADALAVAICQAHSGRLAALGARSGRRRRSLAQATAHRHGNAARPGAQR
jgi:crossover junction endodeoxyribonuclease RuvC